MTPRSAPNRSAATGRANDPPTLAIGASAPSAPGTQHAAGYRYLTAEVDPNDPASIVGGLDRDRVRVERVGPGRVDWCVRASRLSPCGIASKACEDYVRALVVADCGCVPFTFVIHAAMRVLLIRALAIEEGRRRHGLGEEAP